MNGDDNADYVTFLDAIKTERDAAKSVGLDDGIVAAAVNPLNGDEDGDVFYDAQEYEQLMNLMSQRN